MDHLHSCIRFSTAQEKVYYEEATQAITEAELHDRPSGEPVGSVGSFRLESRNLRIPSPGQEKTSHSSARQKRNK